MGLRDNGALGLRKISIQPPRKVETRYEDRFNEIPHVSAPLWHCLRRGLINQSLLVDWIGPNR